MVWLRGVDKLQPVLPVPVLTTACALAHTPGKGAELLTDGMPCWHAKAGCPLEDPFGRQTSTDKAPDAFAVLVCLQKGPQETPLPCRLTQITSMQACMNSLDVAGLQPFFVVGAQRGTCTTQLYLLSDSAITITSFPAECKDRTDFDMLLWLV